MYMYVCMYVLCMHICMYVFPVPSVRQCYLERNKSSSFLFCNKAMSRQNHSIVAKYFCNVFLIISNIIMEYLENMKTMQWKIKSLEVQI